MEPMFPLLTHQILTRQMAIRCMNPYEIVNYSFASKDAAQAVKNARIRVECMHISLFGLDSCGEIPNQEQGITLTFSGCQKKPVLFWFTHDKPLARLPDTDPMFYRKVTINGKVLKKCFKENWTIDNVGYVICCVTLPDQMVRHLKAIENHFRSVFLIDKTNIDLLCSEIKAYSRYFDVQTPKTIRRLTVHKAFDAEQAKIVLKALRPSFINMNVWDWRQKPIKIVADRIRYTPAYMWHFELLVAKQIYFFFDSHQDIKNFIRAWMTNERLLCRDTLEFLKMYAFKTYKQEDLLKDLEEFKPMHFEENRRPRSIKHNMNEDDDDDSEEELDLRHSLDIIRNDGRIATVHLGEKCKRNGKKYSIVWFIVWPRT